MSKNIKSRFFRYFIVCLNLYTVIFNPNIFFVVLGFICLILMLFVIILDKKDKKIEKTEREEQ